MVAVSSVTVEDEEDEEGEDDGAFASLARASRKEGAIAGENERGGEKTERARESAMRERKQVGLLFPEGKKVRGPLAQLDAAPLFFQFFFPRSLSLTLICEQSKSLFSMFASLADSVIQGLRASRAFEAAAELGAVRERGCGTVERILRREIIFKCLTTSTTTTTKKVSFPACRRRRPRPAPARRPAPGDARPARCARGPV